ncbi:MAG: ABC transporter ATP-binding protein [Eisenbergiella massiliensis]
MQLSGGEQQKLAISHVYSGQTVCYSDEPSSALDPIAEYEMYESMMACETAE